MIVTRLFALNWLLHAFALAPSAILMPLPNETPRIWLQYAPTAVLIILAIFLWVFAPAVARLVSRGFDTTVSIANLSRFDLYSFAFVFLGLFFILSSFADVINWMHFFTLLHEYPRHDSSIQDFYRLTRAGLTFAAGLVSLIGAPRWTKKLTSRDQKSLVAQPEDAANH